MKSARNFSESYSDLRDLIKDTSISQSNENSVYNVHSEVEGTARVGGPGSEERELCTHIHHDRHLSRIYEYEDAAGERQCIHHDPALPLGTTIDFNL